MVAAEDLWVVVVADVGLAGALFEEHRDLHHGQQLGRDGEVGLLGFCERVDDKGHERRLAQAIGQPVVGAVDAMDRLEVHEEARGELSVFRAS